MDYIEAILGFKVQYEMWPRETELPFYILDKYEFRLATIGTIKTIFLYPKTELDQMASVKKQIAQIQKLETLPVAIVLKSISRNRREYMISAKIPFVVPDKQLYLPFMGIVLQEQFDAEMIHVEQLQPSAQVLFFYYLYQKKKHLYTNEAINALGFSGMTITRAVRQLEQTDLFITQKEGVQKILISKYDGHELFKRMYPYLISPVRKTIYVKTKTDLPATCTAGLSALSQKSMLNPPTVACYAVNGKNSKLVGTEILMDASTQMEIELWKYAPDILSKNGTVDTLSLIMSLKDNTDERIEDAIEEQLHYIWRD